MHEIMSKAVDKQVSAKKAIGIGKGDCKSLRSLIF